MIRAMKGTSAITGKALSGIEHLRQSVGDILRTPIGSRVARRDYGSRLFSLIDNPTNPSTALAIIAATVDALRKWETRIKVETVRISSAEPGRVVLDITGTYLPDGQVVTFDGIEVY